MATKLKNLNIKKVDFVDAGANPDAHIKLFKRADIDDKLNDAPFLAGHSSITSCIL